MNLILRATRWLFAQDWLRYSLVGGLSSLVLFATSNILKMLGVPTQACTAWGWLATLPVSYFGQRYFTFNPKIKLHPWHLVFYAIAMLLILTSNQVATWFLSSTGLPFVIVSLGVVITVTLVGFTLFRNWVFRPYLTNDRAEKPANFPDSKSQAAEPVNRYHPD